MRRSLHRQGAPYPSRLGTALGGGGGYNAAEAIDHAGNTFVRSAAAAGSNLIKNDRGSAGCATAKPRFRWT